MILDGCFDHCADALKNTIRKNYDLKEQDDAVRQAFDQQQKHHQQLKRQIDMLTDHLEGINDPEQEKLMEDIQTTRGYYVPVVAEDVPAKLQRLLADTPVGAPVETWS